MITIKKFLKYLTVPFVALISLPIIVYKIVLSPILPHTCRYTPTCSSYALSALREFGFFKGGYMALCRLLRCVPWRKGGFDPVPINIKGDFKWLM